MNDNSGLAAAAGKQPPIDLHTIKYMPEAEVASMDPAVLSTLTRQVEDEIRRANLLKDWLHTILKRKYEIRAQEMRQAQGLDMGTVNLDDNGYKISVTLPKRIEWDQDRLAGIIEKLASEGWNLNQIAKVEYKVSERQLNNLPGGVKAMLEQARTIKPGKITFKIIAPGESQAAEQEGDL